MEKSVSPIKQAMRDAGIRSYANSEEVLKDFEKLKTENNLEQVKLLLAEGEYSSFFSLNLKEVGAFENNLELIVSDGELNFDCDDIENKSCYFKYVRLNEKIYQRHNRYYHREVNCHDCAIPNKEENMHHYGCDMEYCPRCDCQLLSCDCRKQGVYKDEPKEVNITNPKTFLKKLLVETRKFRKELTDKVLGKRACELALPAELEKAKTLFSEGKYNKAFSDFRYYVAWAKYFKVPLSKDVKEFNNQIFPFIAEEYIKTSESLRGQGTYYSNALYFLKYRIEDARNDGIKIPTKLQGHYLDICRDTALRLLEKVEKELLPEAIAKEDYYELNEFLMSASQHAKEGGLDISPRADEICKIRNQNLRKAKFNRL